MLRVVAVDYSVSMRSATSLACMAKKSVQNHCLAFRRSFGECADPLWPNPAYATCMFLPVVHPFTDPPRAF